MDNVLCLLCQPQDDVIILASVVFFTEASACLLQQFPAEHSEVTDIIVAPQRIR